jgi:pimeloyl-ACP methyl ester carboxylesterase/class 3 adenylate cyclase
VPLSAIPRSQVLYARSGDVAIAYQVTGESNAIDVVWAPGTASHLALSWERPSVVRTIERLSRFSRLIRFDKRGTGMSDRVTNAATLEERTDDIRAVMDAAGSTAAVILGVSEGGSMASVFAAQYPERTRGLIIWGCQATWVRKPGHPWGYEPEQYDRMVQSLRDSWPSREYIRGWGAGLGPEAADELVDEVLRFAQAAASPAAVVALEEMNSQIDVRDVLPSIRVPTLLLVRAHDPVASVDAVRAMAALIPGARVIVFPGASHQIVGPGLDAESVFVAIEEFVTGSASAATSDRFLATILVLDIVGSTEKAAGLGDAGWRALLDEHYSLARRELARHRGSEIDTAGDGLLATFEGPAAAIRCAGAIQRLDRSLGLSGRAGVHCGEVERAGTGVRGIAVHIASRLAALAEANQVLVTTTVRDLAAGSGLQFEDRGVRELKGVPEPRQVLAVTS